MFTPLERLVIALVLLDLGSIFVAHNASADRGTPGATVCVLGVCALFVGVVMAFKLVIDLIGVARSTSQR